jgi:hypothetical protein
LIFLAEFNPEGEQMKTKPKRPDSSAVCGGEKRAQTASDCAHGETRAGQARRNSATWCLTCGAATADNVTVKYFEEAMLSVRKK